MTAKKESVWGVLSNIDCSEHTEEKNGLTYLSWAWAYKILKDNYPETKVTKHWFDYGGPTNETVPAHRLPYAMDRNGWAYVMVTININGEDATETMPVLNYSNKPVQKPNAFEVNTALQRTLAKAAALHGLAINLYTGEDLSQDASEEPQEAATEEVEEAQVVEDPKEKKDADPLKSLDDWRQAFRDHPDNVVGEEEGSIIFGEAKNESGWKMVRQIVAVFMPRIDDVQGNKRRFKDNATCVKELENFYRLNKKNITLLSKEHPSIHADVMGMFKAAKAAAKKGEVFPLPANKD